MSTPVKAKEKLSKVSSQADDYRHLLADSERRSSSLQVRISESCCHKNIWTYISPKISSNFCCLFCLQDMVNELTSRNINMKLFGEENMIAENEDLNER